MSTTATKSKDFNPNTVNDEVHLTPQPIINALGQFDLDPCTQKIRPFDTAKNHYTKEDDGLLLPWFGRVWCNPPYGRQLIHWLNKCALHGNVTALIYARTETKAFQTYVFPHAHSIFFLQGRVQFLDRDGVPQDNATAPSVLVAYDEFNSDMIADSDLKGHQICLSPTVILITREERTWKVIVGKALAQVDGAADLKTIYTNVILIAPEKTRNNKHYKAKVRQTLQYYFERVSKGKYQN